jgi:hypothetical protein
MIVSRTAVVRPSRHKTRVDYPSRDSTLTHTHRPARRAEPFRAVRRVGRRTRPVRRRIPRPGGGRRKAVSNAAAATMALH